MSMKLDAAEVRRGTIWFVCAGGFAIFLSFFLATVDLKITYSDHEEKKGQEIRDVRMAQNLLTSNVVDHRQETFKGPKPVRAAMNKKHQQKNTHKKQKGSKHKAAKHSDH